MNLASRLKKLEQTAGKGKWCAWCRFVLRSSPPVTESYAGILDTRGRMKKTCQFCNNQYYAQLPLGDKPKERALRLYDSYSEEDFYRDEKACAVGARVRHCGNRSAEEAELREKKHTAARSRQQAARATPEQRLRQDLLVEIGELFTRFEKAMKVKYGEPFPHILELEGKIASSSYTWRSASDELERWRAWATLEQIIFDGPFPETQMRIDEYQEKVAEEAEKTRLEERCDSEQITISTSEDHPQPSGHRN